MIARDVKACMTSGKPVSFAEYRPIKNETNSTEAFVESPNVSDVRRTIPGPQTGSPSIKTKDIEPYDPEGTRTRELVDNGLGLPAVKVLSNTDWMGCADVVGVDRADAETLGDALREGVRDTLWDGVELPESVEDCVAE